FIYAACGSDPGTTPDCVSDVTANGITPTNMGCSGFAECKDNTGQIVRDPMTIATVCCGDVAKDAKQLNLCLFLYGAAPAPDIFGGGMGGGSSSSSSSSGNPDGG